MWEPEEESMAFEGKLEEREDDHVAAVMMGLFGIDQEPPK